MYTCKGITSMTINNIGDVNEEQNSSEVLDVDDLSPLFGVQLFSHCGRADDVGEKNGDRLTLAFKLRA